MLHTVMVIDDSDTDLVYTRIILERSGAAARVLGFESGVEALAWLAGPERSAGPAVDLILLDINMPEMSGFEFLAEYEQRYGTAGSRPVVVMLTSSPDPHDRARAQAFASVRGYVVKPIDAAAASGLAAVIDAAVKAAR